MSVKELPLTKATTDDIVDIDLSVIKKQKFRINGDNDKILELNTSDMGLITRLEESYPKLIKLQEKVVTIADTDDNTDEMGMLSSAASKLREIDNDMRETLDYIFQSNVSETCGSDGSMYDPIDGEFRYEHIITTLLKLYENNMEREFEKMKQRIDKHTSKYTKKRK